MVAVTVGGTDPRDSTVGFQVAHASFKPGTVDFLLVCILRDPTDHLNIRILQNCISGIPLVLNLGTGMSDPYVYVVFWAPTVDRVLL